MTVKRERILAVAAFLIIFAAWIIGAFRAEADFKPYFEEVFPEAETFNPVEGGGVAALKGEEDGKLLGYVHTGSAHGYGGRLKVAVGVGLDGTILGISVIEQKETTAFLQRVIRKGFLESLIGKDYSDAFVLNEDVDSVTGATYTARAFADAVRRAGRKIASKNLGKEVMPEPSPRIQFGIPEIVLILLFAAGFLGRSKNFRYKKTLRWGSLLTGMIVLGFIFNKPLTIVLINKMLLGYLPEWQLHLYWYLLLAGILFVFTKDNKNPYCEWFCPFGAAQECLAVIGGAKVRVGGNLKGILRWFQRTLALTAIILALLYRNPGLSSYEVFGAFFHLVGTTFHFALLGIVLVAALFILRPWCSYLCPLRPVTDFIRIARNWIKDIWLGSRKHRDNKIII